MQIIQTQGLGKLLREGSACKGGAPDPQVPPFDAPAVACPSHLW